MDTRFLATAVKGAARASLRSSVFLLVLVIVALGYWAMWLGLLSLGGLSGTDLVISYVCSGVPGLVILAILGILVRNIIRSIRAIRNPLESSYLSPLKRFGSMQQIVGQIDSEISSVHGKIGTALITPHWLILTPPRSVSVTRLEDVIWMYKNVTQHRVRLYFVISLSHGTTYSASVWDRYGHHLSIPGSENEAAQVLEAILSHAPWVVSGYTDDLAAAWARARSGFIAAVDRKRQDAPAHQMASR